MLGSAFGLAQTGQKAHVLSGKSRSKAALVGTKKAGMGTRLPILHCSAKIKILERLCVHCKYHEMDGSQSISCRTLFYSWFIIAWSLNIVLSLFYIKVKCSPPIYLASFYHNSYRFLSPHRSRLPSNILFLPLFAIPTFTDIKSATHPPSTSSSFPSDYSLRLRLSPPLNTSIGIIY